jgi:transposase
LIPQDHFYRHLEHTIDLSFVRDLVHETYAAAGRPSIDPVVFFRLQLVMFFEDIRSERLLMQLVADRLSARWFLGYNLDEPLPDHSSLSRIRTRYGLSVFRRFFDAIVEQCQQAGLVWGQELYVDATKVLANASVESIKTRFAVEAHLGSLFGADAADPVEMEDAAPPAPDELRVALPEPLCEELTAANESRHDWIAREGRPDRPIIRVFLSSRRRLQGQYH